MSVVHVCCAPSFLVLVVRGNTIVVACAAEARVFELHHLSKGKHLLLTYWTAKSAFHLADDETVSTGMSTHQHCLFCFGQMLCLGFGACLRCLSSVHMGVEGQIVSSTESAVFKILERMMHHLWILIK